MTLSEHLEARRLWLDAHLDRLLPPVSTPPETLHQAMRYAVLGGGKRIRPILCVEAAAVIRDTLDGVEDLACAIEFIHNYSLIHDDLPALDNDDLRRGRPTCHKAFGEATAILAGDALLTLAFETLARLRCPDAETRLAIFSELAAAVGTRNGMIAGQAADLAAEGQAISADQLRAIHSAKTGALIRAAVRAGARWSGAAPESLERLSRYGDHLGLAFQVVDDILDVTSSPAELGKSTRRDAARQKATYPALFGLERSQALARELIDQATAELAPLGPRADRLRELASYLLSRTT